MGRPSRRRHQSRRPLAIQRDRAAARSTRIARPSGNRFESVTRSIHGCVRDSRARAARGRARTRFALATASTARRISSVLARRLPDDVDPLQGESAKLATKRGERHERHERAASRIARTARRAGASAAAALLPSRCGPRRPRRRKPGASFPHSRLRLLAHEVPLSELDDVAGAQRQQEVARAEESLQPFANSFLISNIDQLPVARLARGLGRPAGP